MKSGTSRTGKSHIVSFSEEGKKERASSALPGTTGRPAELLREGSGIKVAGKAGDGLTGSRYITVRMPGISPGK